MIYKILIIDESILLKNFLKEQIEKHETFEVYLAKDGLDGLIKMRNILPDLVIMDYYIPKLRGFAFLKEKQELKSTLDIPTIILSSIMDRKTLLTIGRYKVYKVLSKPIEMDMLIQTIGALFNLNLEIDDEPCIIDVHLNDDILFIEIADGLNIEKISLLKYKILEIKEIFKNDIKRILLIFSNIENQKSFFEKATVLIEEIKVATETSLGNIVVLTNINFIKEFLLNHFKYKYFTITDSFAKAIDSFGKFDLSNMYNEERLDRVKKEIVESLPEEDTFANLKMAFSNEKLKEFEESENEMKKEFNIAVIDDDLPILEYMETVLSQYNWKIHVYENGKIFIDDLKANKPDLIFLDLFMPEMSGFQVLEYLNNSKNEIPVIIITAYPDKDSIIKARSMGVRSYLTKPVKADTIIHKAEEILNSNFLR